MTQPMTPREKVARLIDDAPEHETADELADAIFTALASSSGDHDGLARLAEAATTRLAGPNLNADGFGLQIWGDSLKGGSTHVLDVRGWGYLTGSGNGALGLTREEGISAQRAVQDYAVAAWNAVPSLLAENAALRAERERIAEELHGEINYAAEQSVRATEAERKLAEARGLLEDVQRCTQGPQLDARIRAFLSSTEAERG